MKTTKKTNRLVDVAAVMVLLACTSWIARAQAKPEQLAQQSAESWLALVDSSKYGESWQEASSMGRRKMSKRTRA